MSFTKPFRGKVGEPESKPKGQPDKELSERQQRILEFLIEYIEENGNPPSIREIGAAADISSTSVVSYNLRQLEERGYISRDRELNHKASVKLDKELSKRQQRIFEFLIEYIEENEYPPSIREIGTAADISSTSVVSYNLRRLEEKGYISRDKEVSRGLKLTSTARTQATSETVHPAPLVA